jgi:hypothetical protein
LCLCAHIAHNKTIRKQGPHVQRCGRHHHAHRWQQEQLMLR